MVSDALGQPVSIAETRHEVPGQSLTLTLDANIQQRAEDVLGAVARVFTPKDATAIVMDPRTGAILALANWPQVDANDPGVSPAEAMEDRAVGLDYEPGSTFKVVAVSGALEAGLITPSTPFNIPDEIQVAERTIHDDTEHPEETLTTAQILARSSNVGAIKIGELQGAQRFNGWIHRYGFGAPTGVDLPGEEAGATLPLSEYSGSSMGNLPIGQGELVTPMQMATAYAAIANGGILRPPHIVSAIGGRAVPEPHGHRVITPTTAAEIRQMLEGVLGPEGTASQVSIPGYQTGGQDGYREQDQPGNGRILGKQIRRLVHRLRAGQRSAAAVRGGRGRTRLGLDLRRRGGGAGVRADHELRAALPGHRAGVGALEHARRLAQARAGRVRSMPAMATDRLRYGPMIATVGAALLAVSVFLPWYSFRVTAQGAASARQALESVAAQFGNVAFQDEAKTIGSGFGALAGRQLATVSAHDVFKDFYLVLLILAAIAFFAALARLAGAELSAWASSGQIALVGLLAALYVAFRMVDRPTPPGEAFTVSLGLGIWLALGTRWRSSSGRCGRTVPAGRPIRRNWRRPGRGSPAGRPRPEAWTPET